MRDKNKFPRMKYSFLVLALFIILQRPFFAPHIQVIAPNGGEQWQGGTIHTIAWGYTGAIIKYFRLLFSSDEHKIRLPIQDLSSGIYFLRFDAGDYHKTGKIVLLK